jgi:hypothetical protein
MTTARAQLDQRCARALSILFSSLLQACFVLAPLEEVRPKPESSSLSNAARDAGSPAVRTDAARDDVAADGGKPKPPVVEQEHDDAGPALVRCTNKSPTSCDPVSQCGCKPDHHCALNDAETTIECIAGKGGTRARGEPCQHTSECAVGLQCPRTRFCSPYCSEDAQCGPGERCLPFEDEQKQVTLSGSGSCQTTCDPVTGNECGSNARCDPKVELRLVKYSVCTSTEGMTFSKLGDPCGGSRPACEAKTGCARYGREVCTSLCRTNADCASKEQSRCYVEDRLAAPGDAIGDCWYDPCDNTTIPPPAPWSGGVITSAEDLTRCRTACGARLSVVLDCVQEKCAPGLAACVEQVSMACLGASAGPCRSQYVALNCGDVNERFDTETLLEECGIEHPECDRDVPSLCAGVAP